MDQEWSSSWCTSSSHHRFTSPFISRRLLQARMEFFRGKRPPRWYKTCAVMTLSARSALNFSSRRRAASTKTRGILSLILRRLERGNDNFSSMGVVESPPSTRSTSHRSPFHRGTRSLNTFSGDARFSWSLVSTSLVQMVTRENQGLSTTREMVCKTMNTCRL